MNNNKPITLIREDFIQDMVSLCNNSGLPFFVIEDIIKNLLREIHEASEQQLAADKQKYEEENKKEE